MPADPPEDPPAADTPVWPSDFHMSIDGEPVDNIEDLAEHFRSRRHADDSDLHLLPLALPARGIALAWLAVCIAASSDKEFVAFYRRVNVAVHPYGVALAATDTYWLARAFVPFDGDNASWSPPEMDEVPVWSFTIADSEYRVRDLMKYVERITRPPSGDGPRPRSFPIVITRTTDFDPDIPTLDPTLSAPQVIVEIPDEERIIARESEIEYPNLARLSRFVPKSAEKLLFNPELMSKASTATQRIGSLAMRVTPTSSGSVAFEATACDRHLHGILMPLRDDNEELPT